MLGVSPAVQLRAKGFHIGMSNRFLNTILAIACLAELAAKRGIQASVGAALSIAFLVLAAGNAYALSAACTAINNEWSSGPLVTNQVFRS